jgi:hypothetical protein
LLRGEFDVQVADFEQGLHGFMVAAPGRNRRASGDEQRGSTLQKGYPNEPASN